MFLIRVACEMTVSVFILRICDCNLHKNSFLRWDSTDVSECHRQKIIMQYDHKTMDVIWSETPALPNSEVSCGFTGSLI